MDWNTNSLHEAAGSFATLQKRQALMVACPEEIAPSQRWISVDELRALADLLSKDGCDQYLLQLIK